MQYATVKILLLLFFILPYSSAYAEQCDYCLDISSAGFYATQGSLHGVNPEWRFYVDNLKGKPIELAYDDALWQVSYRLNGIEFLPKEVSCDHNYQGVVWHRKHFILGLDTTSLREQDCRQTLMREP